MSFRQKIFVVAFLIIGGLVLALIHGQDDTKGGQYVPTTYSAGPGGCKALYLLLEELQIPVERFQRPFSLLQPRKGVLVVVEPTRKPFGKRELSKLVEWVKKGNSLIVFEGGLIPREKGRLDFGREGASLISRERGGNSVAQRLGLRLKKTSDSSRTTLHTDSARLYGVNRMSISKSARWIKPSKEWSIIAGDGQGAAIVTKSLGKGRVWAICDATIVSNRFVALEQNVRLLPSILLEKDRPPKVLFDEYHHGYQLADSFWNYIGSSIFAWVFLQLAFGALLFFYSKRALYAGRFKSLSRGDGRSTLEYIDSMANVFETSKASGLALEAMLARTLAVLARRNGVPVQRIEGPYLRQLLIRAGAAPADADVFQACQRAIQSGRDSAHNLALARRLTTVYRFLCRKAPSALPGSEVRSFVASGGRAPRAPLARKLTGMHR